MHGGWSPFYGSGPLVSPRILPAPRWRDWMNATPRRGANRCLPLLMANEAGWILENPAPFTAVWDGSDSRDSIRVEYAPGCPMHHRLASSHFGSGILTFAVPYLFRTAPGFNLLVRGVNGHRVLPAGGHEFPHRQIGWFVVC